MSGSPKMTREGAAAPISHPGDLLPTLDARERLHAFMDGRWAGNRRRSFRDAARETGIHHATLWRFSQGRETSASVLDAICRTWPHSSNLGSRRDPIGHEPRLGPSSQNNAAQPRPSPHQVRA